MLRTMVCTKARITTTYRRLSIGMDSALQRIHADVDRTGLERGTYTTSAESRAQESIAEQVGLKIVNVGEYIKLPSGEYLKEP
jgi:hypothetical protein